MLRSNLLFIALMFCLAAFSGGNFNIELKRQNLGVSLGDKTGYFLDEYKSYNSIDAILDLEDESFKKSDQAILDFKFTANRYWVKFTLTNTSDFDHFIFETGRTVTNKVEYYELQNGELLHTYISGDDYAYNDKEIRHRKNVFPFEIKKGATKTIYIKLESDGELLFAPIIIHERMAFFAQDFKDQFKNGFYYGLIALVVVIYFFFFVFLRDKAFLFYILYAFSQGVFQFSLDGYSHHHLFPNGGYFTNHVLLFFAGLTVIFLLTYVNNFLVLKEKSQSLWKTFIISRGVIFIIVLFSLIPGLPYELSFPIINGASLFAVLLAAYTIIRIRVKGYEVDIFFALAFIVLIIGGVVFILGNLSVVGDKIISLGALKISSALEFVILSISMSNKYGKLQREKEKAQRAALVTLQEKNELMDQSNVLLEEQVKERTAQIEYQKEEILSSIKYAKRIQQAIMPDIESVKEQLQNSFIFYRPKDVVSGDFYFMQKTNTSTAESQGYTILAAVDCTGHGVPGAFMSIVGTNILKQGMTAENVNSPGEALKFLNKGVMASLHNNNKGATIRDGMDIAMIALKDDRSKLIFAGAKNPLYLMREKKNLAQSNFAAEVEIKNENETHFIAQIKGDKNPIGNFFDEVVHEFNNHEVELFQGDQIFLFTDGFADQFGGPKHKKYNYNRFRELLLSIAASTVEEQQAKLGAEFDAWQGAGSQIDDVLVIGFKV